MSRLIEQWRSKKDKVIKDWSRFFSSLKKLRSKKLDKQVTKLHHQVFQQINCLDCANCCKGIPPIIEDDDVIDIADQMGILHIDFINQYTRIDEDGDRVMSGSPCPFLLENNQCSIYAFRPKACASYPLTDKEFSKNLNYHQVNSAYCPATFHILDALNKKLTL